MPKSLMIETHTHTHTHTLPLEILSLKLHKDKICFTSTKNGLANLSDINMGFFSLLNVCYFFCNHVFTIS